MRRSLPKRGGECGPRTAYGASPFELDEERGDAGRGDRELAVAVCGAIRPRSPPLAVGGAAVQELGTWRGGAPAAAMETWLAGSSKASRASARAACCFEPPVPFRTNSANGAVTPATVIEYSFAKAHAAYCLQRAVPLHRGVD